MNSDIKIKSEVSKNEPILKNSENHERIEINNDNKGKWLDNWKIVYNNEVENFYFKFHNYSENNDYHPYSKKKDSDLNKNVLLDIIQLHVYQLKLLEDLKDAIISTKESMELAKYVQQVFFSNQNPKNCKFARKLRCNFEKGCGFACRFHHLMYCFTVALAKGKVLIINEYLEQSTSYYQIFKPLSETCIDNQINNDILVEHLPIIEAYGDKPYLPTAVPTQILKNISLFHTNPFIWWAGQLSSFLFRINDDVKTNILKENPSFEHPIVGIHVRRTDKIGTEAAEHDIEEYICWADIYFEKLKITNPTVQKTIFLATDEPKLLEEAKSKFPEYNFISNSKNSISAKLNRNSYDGLYGIVSDIYYLSQTDYIVCTFSSQVCRLAYELMNSRIGDASLSYKSLDEIYYFGGQIQRKFTSDLKNLKDESYKGFIENQLKFNLRHNDWNGYSQINLFDGDIIHVPSYIIKEEPLKHPFQAFDDYENSQNT